MTKFMEATGKTEEEALAAALRQLGLERDDVSVEIIERAKSGFLGLGSSPARIRVSYEVPDEAEQPKESRRNSLRLLPPSPPPGRKQPAPAKRPPLRRPPWAKRCRMKNPSRSAPFCRV